MPTNQELEEQIEELRKLVSENRQATNTRWSDSPWAIGLQILIAVAAVAIAWAQFNAAASQTDASIKQTRLQEFEIIKSLSNLRPNDSVAVDNLFGYIATLDKDLQQKFINNNLKTSGINYFNYQSYLYLFENFEHDTVKVVGGIMTKIGSYLKTNRLNHITDPLIASRHYNQISPWVSLVLSKAQTLSFTAYQELMTSFSSQFVKGVIVLNTIKDDQGDLSSVKIRDDIDKELMFKVIPYDVSLISGLYGNQIYTVKDLKASVERLISNQSLASTIQFSKPDNLNMAKFITKDYFEDIYNVFLLYLQEAKNEDDFRKHEGFCIDLMKTQKELRKDKRGLSVDVKLNPGFNNDTKKFTLSYRLWLNAEKLNELKQAAEEGKPYQPFLAENK